MANSFHSFDQDAFLTHLQKGKEYFDQDQLQKAREELEAAHQIHPGDEKVLNMLGMTYYKLEMLPEAEAMYIVLAAGNPEVYALQSNLGLIQLKMNKLVEARNALNRALELQPNNSKAHFYLGLLYEKEESWEDALYHFEQANAEKMVAKARMKLEEQALHSKILSPFEIVEILPSQTGEFTPNEFVDAIQKQQEEEIGETVSEITGRMRTQDIAQAIFEVHHSDEIVRPEEFLHTDEEQDGRLTSPIETQPVEEAQQDTIQSSEEEIPEEAHNEASWTKTDPAFFAEEKADTERDTNLLIPSTVDEPFFLSDDIAADISTFLAQSKPEHFEEEDVFDQEPPGELTVLRTSSLENSEEQETPDEPEYRIPTPEEVENEIQAVENEVQSGEEESETAEAVDQEALVESNDQIEPAASVESVEELAEELQNELTLSESPPIETEEDLEVNFAVTEDEEESATMQGFLEASPLTPDIPEFKSEQTQDMEFAAAELRETGKEIAEMVDEIPPVEGQAEAQPEAAHAEESEGAGSPEEEETPANLDQFSRDRLYIQPLIGSDRFLLIDPHLLEMIISDRLICRIGTISSYTGNLQFTPRQEGQEIAPFINVTGQGILFLADRRREIFLISLNNETLFVESNHLLVAQSSLRVEPEKIQQKGSKAALSVVKISGRGTLALTCQTKPLTLNVHEGLPANIPAQAVIAWSGKVVSNVMDDEDLRKIMMSPDDETMFLRFSGTGDVVVEQGGLWGDRRTRR
jgi:uncharacterized protein (AIM24 family)